MTELTTTRLGFRLIHPNQLDKEYDINLNLYLIEFWLNPVIEDFVNEIPDNLSMGQAVIVDNEEHPNHQQIILQLNHPHIIKPATGMRVFWNQQFHYYNSYNWIGDNYD